jgi:hypothetical protein
VGVVHGAPRGFRFWAGNVYTAQRVPRCRRAAAAPVVIFVPRGEVDVIIALILVVCGE